MCACMHAYWRFLLVGVTIYASIVFVVAVAVTIFHVASLKVALSIFYTKLQH